MRAPPLQWTELDAGDEQRLDEKVRRSLSLSLTHTRAYQFVDLHLRIATVDEACGTQGHSSLTPHNKTLTRRLLTREEEYLGTVVNFRPEA
jgi:hypothetical protein